MPRTKPAPSYVLGVGMTKFMKPRGKVDYPELGFEAGIKAMLDAHINYDDVDQGVACYVYGDSTCGQRVFYQFGMTQIPIYNVNSYCSTGSSGLTLARQAISSGSADCVLVIGFEKMFPGSINSQFQDREDPLHLSYSLMEQTRGRTKAPSTAQIFGNAGREYMEKYGARAEDFGEIARVNRKHAKANPYSQFREECSLEQIMGSGNIHEPLTKLQCCPTSDGAAAAVIVSQAFLDEHPHLKSQAVLIAGQKLATDPPGLFSKSAMDLVGYHMSAYAAEKALEEAGITANDVSAIELHDCFSTNEMVVIDAIGLCPKGKAHELVRNGDITYGGKYVVNPSGGLISKGHPLGATGLAQCTELVWQLRGWANTRLVPEAKYCLQHNIGLGGAAVVTVYQRADGKKNSAISDAEVMKVTGLGYNPATAAKGFTRDQVQRVVSQKFQSQWAQQDVENKVQARF
ncbi:uncharacterized protein Z520_02699 [Fonsecaea multimorphosa CBS 102226]|uniref:propanoyl-CoA C-acyltransferase n=1 Tax=Fonsecaea multimorphosa CBS 102226 TaxID=1442371 RepID=A0A0D2IVR0_9EURO|nr:uncharacterized protein Z520_02699 [Fonsecaea multimorphosa CBS 102226]KIY01147.1 hypothetical protein Z520_02699 [Fonsecaea multimorphosa CBS 102226]OAL28764.1 hypothetical protein AYO22_02629 [Fonsecaea multimorphosa]